MTIEIHERETEALIEQWMATGRFKSVEEAMREAFETGALQRPYAGAHSSQRENLADFLLGSPLRGSGLVAERIHDDTRETGL